MAFEEYADYDGLGLSKLVRDGEVSQKEVVEAAISRIEKHNPALNAVVHKAYDEALEAAEEPLGDGPFAGIPFLIKDLDLTIAGWPQSNGSRYTKDAVNSDDAELARRFREAGLNFIGKTNTPEFGITGTTESALLGPCRNPWNPDHIAGGSSGGAASAVASGMVPLAHATDGLGSIRIPAACCGLVGMKPTRDRNPAAPNYREAAHGFVSQHVVTRSVRDSAALLDATDYIDPTLPAGAPQKRRPYMQELQLSPGRLRIAYSTSTPSGAPIDPQVEAGINKVLKYLESAGHWVEPKELSVDWRDFYFHQAVKSAAHFHAEMRHRIDAIGREPEREELEPLTWSAYEGGAKVTGGMVAEATRALYQHSSEIMRQLSPYDVFLTPVMTAPPPRIGHIDPVALSPKECNSRMGKLYPYTPPFNVTGQPSMSLPLVQSDDGLPIGVQFTGRYGDEATLFQLAAQLEEDMPWAGRQPQLWN